MLINLEDSPVSVLILVFVVAAIVVWIAGTRLSKLANDLSEQTGVGRAFIGLLMLGGITSLPEVATSVTASVEGNAGMAVSNIMGGVSMQVTILAVIDFWVRKQPISTSISNIVVLMQGVLVITMLALSGMFTLAPSFTIFHVGINSILLFIIFLISLYFSHRFRSLYWLSYDKSSLKNINQHIESLHRLEEQRQKGRAAKGGAAEEEKKEKTTVGAYLKRTGGILVFLSLLILAAGYFVVKSSEAFAERTGIGTNFAGLVLVAITTSLPEISTTIGAVKLQQNEMAFSNIFGTNLFDISLIFITDLFYTEGAVFAAIDEFAVVAVFHGIILTAIYLIGISIKTRKLFLNIGYDSWLIMLTYLSGIFLLYNLGG